MSAGKELANRKGNKMDISGIVIAATLFTMAGVMLKAAITEFKDASREK